MYTTVDLLSSYLFSSIVGCIGPKQLCQGAIIQVNLFMVFWIQDKNCSPHTSDCPSGGLRGGMAWS